MSDVVGTSGNWNLPNVLTGVRILIVPFYGVALLHDGGQSIPWRTVAAVLFLVAMVTDKVDGDIARSRGLVTDFGKIADPIADKAMTGMAFIGLSIVGDIWWWVTILVLLREWSVTLLRLSILRQVVVAAAQSGKIKTVLQAVALTSLSLPLLLLEGPLHADEVAEAGPRIVARCLMPFKGHPLEWSAQVRVAESHSRVHNP